MQFKFRPISLVVFGGAIGITVAGCATPTPPPSPSPVPTNTPGAVVITAPPQSPVFIASLTPIPTDIPAPTQTLAPTIGPTITNSGPIIVPEPTNAQSFVQKAPTGSGPFQIVSVPATLTGSAALTATPNIYAPVINQYGSAFYYRTDDGALYQVVLWITNSDGDALEHFTVDKDSMTAPQPLQLGNEAYYSMVDLHLMVIVRYRNAVIDIYRPVPNSTVPTVKPTDQQVKDLAAQIFAAIPPIPSS